MTTNTYKINAGSTKFSDMKSKSDFLDRYTNSSKVVKNSYYGRPVTTTIYTTSPNSKSSALSWLDDYYEAPAATTNKKYTFIINTDKKKDAKYIPIYDFTAYTKKYDDYDFFTADGQQIFINDTHIRIGFDVYPTHVLNSFFNGFNIFKKKKAEKKIVITLNFK